MSTQAQTALLLPLIHVSTHEQSAPSSSSAAMVANGLRPFSLLSLLCLVCSAWSALAYEVPVSDTDYDRQICSGMWASGSTYINGASAVAVACT